MYQPPDSRYPLRRFSRNNFDDLFPFNLLQNGTQQSVLFCGHARQAGSGTMTFEVCGNVLVESSLKSIKNPRRHGMHFTSQHLVSRPTG